MENTQKPLASSETTVGPAQIYALVGYYILLLIASGAMLVFLIVSEDQIKPKLLVVVGLVSSGALSGSVLYQVRMLYKHYVQQRNFEVRWLGKYITGPWESIALALAVLSLIQGGGTVFGGKAFTLTTDNTFSMFGLGALIGFGIREVIGWLGNLAKATFPTDQKDQKPQGRGSNEA